MGPEQALLSEVKWLDSFTASPCLYQETHTVAQTENVFKEKMKEQRVKQKKIKSHLEPECIQIKTDCGRDAKTRQ